MSRRMRLQVRPNLNRAIRDSPKVPVEIKIEDEKKDDVTAPEIKEEDTKPEIVLLPDTTTETVPESSGENLVSEVVVEQFTFVEPEPVSDRCSSTVIDSFPETSLPPVSVPSSIAQGASSTEVLQAILTSPVRLIQRPRVEPQQKPKKSYVKGKTPPERNKMTMMDLIYWNPQDNPMPPPENCTTNVDEEIVGAEEPGIEKQEKDEMNMHFDDEDPNVSMLAPKLKIGPNNEIIIDEESLVIHQKRPEDFSVVHEDHATNYSSFRKKISTDKWSKLDTIKFYKALSIVGTDFALMASLIPPRSRVELKLKFKSEEKRNREFLFKVLHNPDLFDISEFEKEVADIADFIEIKQPEEDLEPKKTKRRYVKRKSQDENSNEKNSDVLLSNNTSEFQNEEAKKLKGKRGRKPKLQAVQNIPESSEIYILQTENQILNIEPNNCTVEDENSDAKKTKNKRGRKPKQKADVNSELQNPLESINNDILGRRKQNRKLAKASGDAMTKINRTRKAKQKSPMDSCADSTSGPVNQSQKPKSKRGRKKKVDVNEIRELLVPSDNNDTSELVIANRESELCDHSSISDTENRKVTESKSKRVKKQKQKTNEGFGKIRNPLLSYAQDNITETGMQNLNESLNGNMATEPEFRTQILAVTSSDSETDAGNTEITKTTGKRGRKQKIVFPSQKKFKRKRKFVIESDTEDEIDMKDMEELEIKIVKPIESELMEYEKKLKVVDLSPVKGIGEKRTIAHRNTLKRRNPPPGLYDIKDEDSNEQLQDESNAQIDSKSSPHRKPTEDVIVSMEECPDDSQKIILLSETGDVLPYDLIYDESVFDETLKNETIIPDS